MTDKDPLRPLQQWPHADAQGEAREGGGGGWWGSEQVRLNGQSSLRQYAVATRSFNNTDITNNGQRPARSMNEAHVCAAGGADWHGAVATAPGCVAQALSPEAVAVATEVVEAVAQAGQQAGVVTHQLVRWAASSGCGAICKSHHAAGTCHACNITYCCIVANPPPPPPRFECDSTTVQDTGDPI
jgi:hypothetical protein